MIKIFVWIYFLKELIFVKELHFYFILLSLFLFYTLLFFHYPNILSASVPPPILVFYPFSFVPSLPEFLLPYSFAFPFLLTSWCDKKSRETTFIGFPCNTSENQCCNFPPASMYANTLEQTLFSPRRPTMLCETMGKAEIWLIRTYWDFEFPCPYLPNFEFVGGLYCKSAKPLPRWTRWRSLSHVRLFATPWTVAYQAPLSMVFSRQ